MKKSLFPSFSHLTGNENLCVFYVLDREEKARKEEFIKIMLLFFFSYTLRGCRRVGVRRTEECQKYDSEHTMVEKKEKSNGYLDKCICSNDG